MEVFRRFSPNTLIDVGANKGQFSLMARYVFPNIAIHAFEPLESESRLFRAVVRPPARLYPTALGCSTGAASFFVASRADSSSLLRPGGAEETFYGVRTESVIKVPVARLPDVIDIAELKRPILLKIDVQGGEMEVLKGAESCLSQFDIIYCEASYVELYEGQPLAGEIVAYLVAHNFALAGVFNQFLTPALEPTQADLLFITDSDKR